jgi:putative oxidoreductase
MPDNVTDKSFIQKLIHGEASLRWSLGQLTPIADLIARLWVAYAFYASGLTKVTSSSVSLFGFQLGYPTSLVPTDSTILLFEYEYEVPLLSPVLAAYLGSAAEVILPLFLAFGLLGRYAALALFLFNIVAVLSYPPAQTGAGFVQHQAWGILLLITLCHGPGRLSLDYLIEKFLRK